MVPTMSVASELLRLLVDHFNFLDNMTTTTISTSWIARCSRDLVSALDR
jgi:hypothetical protein